MYSLMSARSTNAGSEESVLPSSLRHTNRACEIGCGKHEHIVVTLELVQLCEQGIDHLACQLRNCESDVHAKRRTAPNQTLPQREQLSMTQPRL